MRYARLDGSLSGDFAFMEDAIRHQRAELAEADRVAETRRREAIQRRIQRGVETAEELLEYSKLQDAELLELRKMIRAQGELIRSLSSRVDRAVEYVAKIDEAERAAKQAVRDEEERALKERVRRELADREEARKPCVRRVVVKTATGYEWQDRLFPNRAAAEASGHDQWQARVAKGDPPQDWLDFVAREAEMLREARARGPFPDPPRPPRARRTRKAAGR